MDLPSAPAAPDEPAATDRWERLDRRTLAVNAVYATGVAIAAGTGAVTRGGIQLWLVLLGAVVLIGGWVALDLLRWMKTRYRITGERFELHTGLLFRTRRSIPTERIRSVDAIANPVQRVFGVTVVKIGTGEKAGKDDEIKLDVVARQTGDALRGTLLRRARQVQSAPAASQEAGQAPPDEPAGDAENALARIDWAWIRYAPLTLSSVLGIGVVFGVVYKPLELLGLNPFQMGLVREAIVEFEAHPLWVSISVLAGAALVLGVLGSLVLFVEAWWRFRLTHENTEGTETFRVRRGLLTTRSLTLERRRLRGVEVAEPMLLRWGGGARTYAVATGMSEENKSIERTDTLLPPTPRAVSDRVAAEVLGSDVPDVTGSEAAGSEATGAGASPTSAVRLESHPRAALRRRMVWSLAPIVAFAAVLAGLGGVFDWFPGWAWWAALALLPVAAPFARDAYRNLGHGLTERYLVTRSGTGVRRTVALQRSGVLGWTVRQSLLQRRAGLATVTATTAAGHGAYHVRDVGIEAGLVFAERAVPDLLTPFLERPDHLEDRHAH
ncbi:MAG: PH domain-containing protein [Pseudonocardiaceae bacterium]|nr:PH domain-containing protein [Pseudonocardiaceae bacterium]